jgi:hypothetical protein
MGIMSIKCLGVDEDGITEISLESLKKLGKRKLLKIEISKIDLVQKCCRFIFEDGYYDASGFNIGYAGEGPRGLWKAICMFEPSVYDTFDSSGIKDLNHSRYD